ncbi:MAG: glycosyltransferase [Verrucomicrobiota bacterium]|nr:glycosyltransferase [Verrucomicrobiota bacterium]
MAQFKNNESSRPHVTVCICTYRRADFLRRLLDELARQETRGLFAFSVAVCDNDSAGSAATVVAAFKEANDLSVSYSSEPRQNIALARNRVWADAQGEFVAFIDDDEFPAPDWLEKLYSACLTYQSAGVLGPVRPHFEQAPPRWILQGQFCERPEHATGRVMKWDESRTGNVLIRRSIVGNDPAPFKAEFGNGGEDKDFFMRMTERGAVFVWCNEAIAYETVPPSRWTRSYMLKRALLRGRNILKHPKGRVDAIVKSVLALPIYSIILPFTLLFGQRCFMKYSIKFCDHLGRFLALLGMNPVARQV